MNTAMDKLLAIAGNQLLPAWDVEDESLLSQKGHLGKELLEVLRKRNGFYAFESSLHVLPLGKSRETLTLGYWNDPHGWRQEFGKLIPSDLVFFAEDAFGNQFAFGQDGVSLFYPEFAEVEHLTDSLEEWAKLILSDWRGYTGYDLAHEWQLANGPLQERQRLLPKVPFVIGGKYEIANLYAGDILQAMRFRASLASQIANLPDGTAVRMRVI
jgi:hypothetical protein